MQTAPAQAEGRTNIILFFGALVVIAALHLTSLPRTIWEYDESLFAMAVEKYEPGRHHPPPPGYPIYIGVAKLVQPLAGYVPFRTLVGLSAFTAIAGFVLLAFAFRAVTGSPRTGILGAFLFYVSPTMLLHATLPQSDSGALALLAASVLLCALAVAGRVHVAAAAIVCAITIGWRLQFSIAIVPMFFTFLLLLRTWRERFVAVQWFGVTCAAWLIALIGAIGDVEGFWKWMSGQASEFARHDANISRSGRSTADIVLRFVAHPWGPKWLSMPLLALAATGFVDAVRRRVKLVIPMAVMSAVYFAFALAMMDPADGVRYALPALPAVAMFAAIGLTTLRGLSREVLVDWALVGLYAFGAYVYVGPLLRQRVDTPSPPYAAIQYIRSVAPRNAVILFDTPLLPHAEYLLRGYTRMKVDAGLLKYGHRMDVPIYELTDSATEVAHGKVFRWATPDAYTKLTRGHYGAASVVPLQATQRFQVLEGVSAPERTRTGSWRWVLERGAIRLPDIGADRVRLTFEVPADYPYPSNRVTVSVDGGGASETAIVVPGKKTIVDVPITGGATLRITPERTFLPAKVNPLNRDPRTLSVMLTGVEQVGRSAVPATAQRSP